MRKKASKRSSASSLLVHAALALALALASDLVPHAAGEAHAEAARRFDLSEARILRQVLLRVTDAYVDPSRVRPKLMLVQGLEWIQQSVAEVQVRSEQPPAAWDPPECRVVEDCRGVAWPLSSEGSFECFEGSCLPIPAELTVQVDTAVRRFPTRDVRGPWDLSRRMREIFVFLQENLHDDVELPEVEYAAVNGMLSTLDPHSNLLVPEVFEEMQLGTRGEFGGLGIVISMHPGEPCGGHLTVMEVMDGSPAETVDLRRMDRIVRIGDQPTACMDLSEAVSRLRGTPGTSVRVWIQRGSAALRPIDIVRAQIQIDSVESRMLEDAVGYVRIKSFQVNTTTELRSHLAELHGQGMQALVLDLRDNPGGLLDQAVRVADTFMSQGTIVVTAGARPEDREARQAESVGTEPDYPMVVLVNGGSASASEIVAGALHNQGRAILVGDRTFGKGSVQTLYEFDDGSALKLTVAQYLTPGEESIQSVGIAPDVEFGTMTVQRELIDLTPRSRMMRESDLGQHLEHAGHAGGGATLRLLLLGREEEPDAGECPRPLRCDRPEEEPWSAVAVEFARTLLARRPGSSRASLLGAARRLVEERQAAEIQSVAEALAAFRVDWSDGQDDGEAAIEASVSVGPAGDRCEAGTSVALRVRARNRGRATLHRVRGTTHSDNPLLDDLELVFGRLAPGQTRTWDVPICVPDGATSRADPVTVTFEDSGGHSFEEASARVTVEGLRDPSFSYGVQLVDLEGNGDGRLQAGERAKVRLVVRNEGPGEAREADVRWRNKAGDLVVVRSCRHALGRLRVGEQRVLETEVEVDGSYAERSVPLELSITDMRLHEQLVERIEIPLAQSASAPASVSRVVAVTAEGVPLREAPGADARVVAEAGAGAAFRATAEAGGFLRVDLGAGRPAWIATSDTTPATRVAPSVTEAMANRPPRIALDATPPLAVRGETLHLEGLVTDPDRVLDMYVFVGSRKVFYLSNRPGSEAGRLPFSMDVPLAGGSNQVLIVARETADLVARRYLIVRRDNPDGTPIRTRERLEGEEEETEP